MHSRAFTLIEILTAMGIFCIAVLGLMWALTGTVEASREVQRQKLIRNELESRLARISLPPLKTHTKTEEVAGIAFTEDLRPEQVKTKDLGLQAGYWKVLVRAEWKENGRRQQWEASHLAYQP